MPSRITASLVLSLSLALPLAVRAEPGASSFSIDSFELRGNSLLDEMTVERTVYPFLGEGRGIADVEAARDALQARYREAGYPSVVVDIPEQSAFSGVIRLEIRENVVRQVEVSGADYFSARDIRRALPSLQEGTVMNYPQVRSEISQLNRANPDLGITPVIKGGARPGEVDVELKVEDALPVHASLELNNRYAADTSHLRGQASLSYGNLWQKNHNASLSYQFSPEKTEEVKALVGTYVMPVGDAADKLAFYGVKSESSSLPAGVLSVLGDGYIYGLRWIHPMEARPSYFHSMTLGFDYKDFSDSIALDDSTDIETPISYGQASLEYNGNLVPATEEGELAPAYETHFSIGATMGPGGGMNNVDEFQEKADGAKPSYAYVRESIEHSQRLPLALEAYLKLEAQQTGATLISNEQFTLGGADSVRGYLESQVSGDIGQVMQAELRSMPLLQGQWLVDQLVVFAFRDWGYARLVTDYRPGGQAREQRIASYGLGLRLSLHDALKIDTAWAYPTVENGDVARGDELLHFSLICEF